ncbi:hypothetical protein [Streptococcus pneumoniae]|uniref:hypothetical protein n=1 Tax=Streptococcus pneumoniae TaxID=1313 RepID=UPI000B1F6D74|nr:hypothetical protein [Streptococcus pneumoniae]
MKLTKSAQNTVLRLRWKLTRFEEIFEEYKTEKSKFDSYLDSSQALIFYSLQ